jgi:cytoskeletal protein CcmA (bactofilin family)
MLKKTSPQNENSTPPMVISRQSHLRGDFVLSTDVRIDGYVDGNVYTTQSVVVGENGHLKGNLKCRDLKLFGRIEGDADVGESAFFYSTAFYNGRLNVPSIGVSAGCVIKADINLEEELSGRRMEFHVPEKNVSVDFASPSKSDRPFDLVNSSSSPSSGNGKNIQSESQSFLFKNLK